MKNIVTLLTSLAITLSGIVSTSTAADSFTEIFNNGSNVGRWSYGAPFEDIDSTGGNPGSFLHISGIDTFAPRPHTALGDTSPFVGNYRTQRVNMIGVDLKLFHVDASAGDRPLTLMLFNDQGTPFDPSDDVGAYFMGPNIPLVGEGWKHFQYDIPSGTTSLPTGWSSFDGTGNGNPVDWNALMEDVDQVMFFYGNPENFFIFQMWECGFDNPSITCEGPATDLVDFEVVFGDVLDGGVEELRTSDDTYLHTRSHPGFVVQ